MLGPVRKGNAAKSSVGGAARSRGGRSLFGQQFFVLLRDLKGEETGTHGLTGLRRRLRRKREYLAALGERNVWKNREIFKWDLRDILPHKHYGRLPSTSHKTFHKTYLSDFSERNYIWALIMN